MATTRATTGHTVTPKRGMNAVAQIVNPVTGEVVLLESATDDELIAQVRELDRLLEAANVAVRGCKAVIQERMIKTGATLRITPLGKVRIRYTSKVADKRLVEALYNECPQELRKASFAFDIRPLKTGLNELAKLGSEWKGKVDTLYEQTPSLIFEWTEGQQQTEEDLPEGFVAPF